MRNLGTGFDRWFDDFCRDNFGIVDDEGKRRVLEALLERMDREENLNPPKPEGECFFCHKPTTDWDFCHGCGEHVCNECYGDMEFLPVGNKHAVAEHKAFTN